MNAVITSMSGEATSPQVSSLMTIEHSACVGKRWEPGFKFLLKVCSSEAVQCEVLPASGSEWVETSMSSGWNPELIKGLNVVDTTAAADNVYQAGW